MNLLTGNSSEQFLYVTQCHIRLELDRYNNSYRGRIILLGLIP